MLKGQVQCAGCGVWHFPKQCWIHERCAKRRAVPRFDFKANRGKCSNCGGAAYSPGAYRCEDCFVGCRPVSIETAMRKAIKTGALKDPKKCKCVDCGRPATCYDHRDYNKPLDVDPVCSRCNSHRGPAIPFAGRPAMQPE